MFIGLKLQYNFNSITILTNCSCQDCATFMFAGSTGTRERCVGFSCGRGAVYVAGIWFGSLFKMIRFEMFVFVSFQYFSFGFGRTFLRVKKCFPNWHVRRLLLSLRQPGRGRSGIVLRYCRNTVIMIKKYLVSQ